MERTLTSDYVRTLLARALPGLDPRARRALAEQLRDALAREPKLSGPASHSPDTQASALTGDPLPQRVSDQTTTFWDTPRLNVSTHEVPLPGRGPNHGLVIQAYSQRLLDLRTGQARQAAEAAASVLLSMLEGDSPHAASPALPPPSVPKDGACVCLVLTRREWPAADKLMSLWSLLGSDADTAAEIDLALCFDNHDPDVSRTAAEAIARYGLARHFRHIRVIDAGVPEEFNFYHRAEPPGWKPQRFPYGWKSGPNIQFFRTLRHAELAGYAEILLIETDCCPLGADWARLIFEDAARRPGFWVMGSPFRGRSRVGPEIMLHLNGVAVYRTAELGFAAMLAEWEARLLELCARHPETAYDCAQEMYYWHKLRPENWSRMSEADVHDYQHFRQMFVMTERIVNLAGEPEREGAGRYSLPEAEAKFPRARLFHANYLFEATLARAQYHARGRAADLSHHHEP